MVLSWGKPNLFIRLIKEGGTFSAWRLLPTPKEDSTQLSTSEGDKTEAKAEGGAIVDVMYKKSSFELAADFFIKKGENKPFDDKDGIVSGNYELALQPDNDKDAVGLYMQKVNIAVTTNYTAADGITQNIKFSAMEKDGNTPQMELGTVKMTGSKGSWTLDFDAIDAETDATA